MTSISYKEASQYQLDILKYMLIDVWEEVKDAEAGVIIWRQLKAKKVRRSTIKLKKAIERFLSICEENHLEPQL